MTATLRTGQLAKAAGVNAQTLRYYERRGLLAQPERTLGGHRLYPPETVTALRMIKTAQRLGFSLEDVAEVMEIGRRREGGLHDRTVAKLAEIESRIADLESIRETLRAAVGAGCDDLAACARNEDCPLNTRGAGASRCTCCP